MFCPYCGAKVEEEQKFCPNCGKPVARKDGAQQDTGQEHQTQDIIQSQLNNNNKQRLENQVPQQNVSQQKLPKKKKHWLLIIIIVIILIIIAATALGSNDNSGSDSVSDSSSQNTSENSTEKKSSKASGSDLVSEYESIGDNDKMPFKLTEKAEQFLSDHPELFPEKGDIDDKFVDYNLNFRQIVKNPSKYGDKLLYIQQGQVVETYESDDESLTEINVTDGEQQYWIFYLGTLDSIYEDSTVSVYGLPLNTSSFKNTDGGSTSVVVLAGSKVTDYNESSADTENDNSTSEDSTSDDRDYEQEQYEEELSQNYVLPYSDTEELDDDTVASLSDEELRYAINEMYARHGYHFSTPAMQDYFSSVDWYVDKGITDQNQIKDEMSSVEKKNLKKLTQERESRS